MAPFWLDPHVRPPFVSSFIHIFIHETMVGKPTIQHHPHIRKSHQIISDLSPKLTPDPQVIQVIARKSSQNLSQIHLKIMEHHPVYHHQTYVASGNLR